MNGCILALVLSSILPHAAEEPLVAVPAMSPSFTAEKELTRAARLQKDLQLMQDAPIYGEQGATEFAPAGSLEALEAAADLGVWTATVRVRQTLDGVLVLFPDETLELQLDGIGEVKKTYFEELQLYTRHGLQIGAFHVPALHEAIELCRTKIDLSLTLERDRGLRDTIRAIKDESRVVVGSSRATTSWTVSEQALSPMDGVDATLASLDRNQRRRPRHVVDPRAALSQLGQPIRSVQLQDQSPKRIQSAGNLADYVAVLKREQSSTSRRSEGEISPRLALVRLAIHAPRELVALSSQLANSNDAEVRQALAWNLGMIAKHRRELVTPEEEAVLLRLLSDSEPNVRAEAAVACGRARLVAAEPIVVNQLAVDPRPRLPIEFATVEEIGNRAKLAQSLGLLGVRTAEGIGVLEKVLQTPTPHFDPKWARLDGGLAAWALGQLGAKESVSALSVALMTARSAEGKRGIPIDRAHWFASQALARLGTDSALIALETAMNTPPDKRFPENDRLGALAAAGLRRFPMEDRAAILAKLLVHENFLVRRAGVLGCLQEKAPSCRTLLELGASWAVPWWDAQHAKP